jgi:hypothetical protein
LEIKKRKTLAEMEEEAKREHMVKLLFQKDGKTYATFHRPGSTIRSQDGKIYQVAEDGSLRRIKKTEDRAR